MSYIHTRSQNHLFYWISWLSFSQIFGIHPFHPRANSSDWMLITISISGFICWNEDETKENKRCRQVDTHSIIPHFTCTHHHLVIIIIPIKMWFRVLLVGFHLFVIICIVHRRRHAVCSQLVSVWKKKILCIIVTLRDSTIHCRK